MAEAWQPTDHSFDIICRSKDHPDISKQDCASPSPTECIIDSCSEIIPGPSNQDAAVPKDLLVNGIIVLTDENSVSDTIDQEASIEENDVPQPVNICASFCSTPKSSLVRRSPAEKSDYIECDLKKRKLDVNDARPNKRPLVPEEEHNCLSPNTQMIPRASTLTPSNRWPVIPTKDNPPTEMPNWLGQFTRWSNAERIMALTELIDRCVPTQVRHIMQVIEPQFQRDFISLLPKELALKVLSFLDPPDLLKAAQTCHSWKMLADDNLLWKEKCREVGVEDVPARRVITRVIKIKMSPWKAAYMRFHDIEMNWRHSPIRTPKMLKGHDDHVITCLQFSGNKIVSGSDDNTLKVWSAISGKLMRTLSGHTGGVWSSQMSGNIVISGSTDRTLKVWDAESGICQHTLFGHTSTVRCMHLHGNKVVSGSRDATLRVWNIETGEFLHVLVGHLAAVRCVQYDGRLVVSGAYDYMVKVWKPETEECLHTLQGHTNRVYSLQNNILVSGNADSTVKVWDILTGQCLQTLSGKRDYVDAICMVEAGPSKHQSAVTCLQFNSRFVITSSDDGTVKLWDLRTGEFIRNLVTLESGGSGGVVWRIRANETKLVCAVGSRNGTEETKLLVLDFDVDNNSNSFIMR
ncbi:hypothetical protein D910_00642 [Dendroctonus ponderosae]